MTSSPATRGFLFADLRDYTRFVDTHGDEAAAGLLKAYRALMRDVIGRFGAAEIKTEGDSFYIVFPSASTAIEGGLAILKAVAEETAANPDRPIRVGIGIHAGETEETGEGPVGLAVNIAARVCSRAKPGELLVTDTVRSLTRTRMSVSFQPRGSQRLKGIADPIALFAVVPVNESLPDPAGRLRLMPTAAAAAFLVFIAVAAVVLLLMRPAAHSRGLASLQCAAASATPPPLADVSTYRADVNRTSVYPGPGPECQPKLVWQQRLGAVPNFVPIVVAGNVIVGDQSGLYAFDGRSGKPVWTLAGSGGFAESALADQGVVFAADLNGTLHAIDAHAGTELWKRPLPNNGIHPTISAGLVWVGSFDGHAYGLDPSTGEERWRWDAPEAKPVDVGLVTDETAYLTSGGTLYAVRLVDRSELWHHDTGSDRLAGPTTNGDTLYIAGLPKQGGVAGALLAIDAKTGANRWHPFGIANGAQITPGPVRGSVVYVTTNGDGVYALRDDGSTYETVWHNPNVSFSYRPASLAGDLLYVQQTESTLVALRADTGQLAWTAPGGLPAEETPVVTGGLIFQVDDEGGFLRAWAEPGLAAKLGAPLASSSPSQSPARAPNPFAVVATFPWFETGIQVPAAMTIGPDGFLYVLHAKADYSNPKVTIIDPKTGRPVGSWGRYGSGSGELDLTSGGGNGPGGCIDIAPDGLIYVGERGNRRVEVFTRDGSLVRQIGEGQLGPVLFCQLGTDGSLYTEEDEPGYFSKFSATGKLVWRRLFDPAHPSTGFQLHGVVVRPDGKLVGFVDSTGKAVVLEPVTGRVLSSWGKPGSEPGQLGLSGEPSLDANGNIYVFQYVPQAVQVFDPNGRLIGGIYQEGPETTTSQFNGTVFWPPPVFAKDGFGYSFGPDGLIRLKVTLPKG